MLENYFNIDSKICYNFFKFLLENNNYAIIAHEDPDGDAISAIYSIAYFLKYLNKNLKIYLKNYPPQNYQIAPFKINLIDNAKLINENNIIVVDCSNTARPYIKGLELKPILANIDHHQDNNYFAKYNIVLPESPSTAEILFELFKCYINNFKITEKEMKNFLNKELLNSLLLGILYDTYYFNTENTSYSTFKNVGQIIKMGGELHKIKEQLFKQKDTIVYKIWGHILNNLKVFKNGKIILTYFDKTIYKNLTNNFYSIKPKSPDNRINTKYIPDYNIVTEGFINHLSSLKNCELIIFLREHDGFIKGSVRSSSGFAAQFANIFNGGGHKNAAGFKLKESLPAAIEIVKKEILKFKFI